MVYRMNSTQYNLLRNGGFGREPKSHRDIVNSLNAEARRSSGYITDIVVFADTVDRTKYKKQ